MQVISNGNVFITVMLGLVVLAVWDSHAIITRHDLSDSNYVVADADYPALVDLFRPNDCIGTLVHQSYLLTCAHCAVDLRKGRSLEVNGISHDIAEIILHPKWRKRRDEYDIALVRFEKPVKGVSPLPIYRGTGEIGSIITLVGRGDHATGLDGERRAKSDGKLRRATNIVSGVDDHFIEIFFEKPGEDGITNLEGVGASGDSGCPGFIDVDGVLYIAGLNSWGDGGQGIKVGQYGSRDYQTRVSQYLEWLDSEVDLPDSLASDTPLFILTVNATRLPSGAIDQLLLSFPAISGKSYTIEASPDTKSWQSIESDIVGAGNIIERNFPTRATTWFLRVKKE